MMSNKTFCKSVLILIERTTPVAALRRAPCLFYKEYLEGLVRAGELLDHFYDTNPRQMC